MLADDILFFQSRPIDMIGMGPWLPHETSPMKDWEETPEPEARLQLAFNMIAAVRQACPEVNIAASTALQAMVPDGRERGLTYGANVTMPNLTPVGGRAKTKRPGHQASSLIDPGLAGRHRGTWVPPGDGVTAKALHGRPLQRGPWKDFEDQPPTAMRFMSFM